jgi:hypothetical protein
MKKGTQPSAERNIMMDELNRTDFRNFAATMGFFASPYEYLFEVANKIFKNPNFVTGIIDPRWIFIATMNISDVGNERLSLAYKSRFNSVYIGYSIENALQILDMSLLGLSRSEEIMFMSIVSKTEELAESGQILFPAGIRHLDALFKSIRRISNEIMQENNLIELVYQVPTNITDKDEKKKYILGKFLESKLFSTIVLPLSDESSKTIMEKVKDDINNDIPSYIEELWKDITSDKFNKYY